MRITLTAHFDGEVIVPHEKLSLPTGEPLTVEVVTGESSESPTIESRRAAFERLNARAVGGLSIPPEALGRESIYGDD